jgi:hypothetical protein
MGYETNGLLRGYVAQRLGVTYFLFRNSGMPKDYVYREKPEVCYEKRRK